MKKKSVLADLIGAAAVFLLAFLVSFYDVFYSFDSLMRDKLYQQPRGINNKIKIIAIDDETLREVGAFGTWSRGAFVYSLTGITNDEKEHGYEQISDNTAAE